jgi:hypothetical protein
MQDKRFAGDLEGGATVAALGTEPVAVIGPPPAHRKEGLSAWADTTE